MYMYICNKYTFINIIWHLPDQWEWLCRGINISRGRCDIGANYPRNYETIIWQVICIQFTLVVYSRIPVYHAQSTGVRAYFRKWWRAKTLIHEHTPQLPINFRSEKQCFVQKGRYNIGISNHIWQNPSPQLFTLTSVVYIQSGETLLYVHRFGLWDSSGIKDV